MERFYHPAAQAGGMCKNCCKGICRRCAIDLGFSLACPHCHEEVRVCNDLIQRGTTAYTATGGTYRSVAIIFGILGTVVFGLGLFLSRSPNPWIASVFVPFGLFLVLVAIVYFNAARKLTRHTPAPEQA